MQDTAKPENLKSRLATHQEYLKQIVFGGNDGIVTTFAIVTGFQGARADGTEQIAALAILVFGFANLFADGVSMGLGEFLSGRSERDLYNAQYHEILRAARQDPARETQALAAVFMARGLNAQDSRLIAEKIRANPALFAEMLLTFGQERPEPDHGNLPARALMTFLSFILFGFIPILPYVLLPAEAGTFYIALAATFSALALLGLLRWKATEESLIRCVGETLLLGGICALVAYGVGAYVGSFG